ncbi:hypothetical protein O181_021875, partial [Austropuccinia psidii MF-1]|nr:hypothetical protein [Austropuccinia psidii MF-1]
NSPPAKNKIFQISKADPNPTERAFIDFKPSVNQLSENLDRGPPMEGAVPSRRGGINSRSREFYSFLGVYPGISQRPRSRLGEAEDEEGEESVEEEDSEDTEVEASFTGTPDASEALNLALSNQPLVSQAEPNFLKMMEQVTQFMVQLMQAASPRDNSRAQ